MTTTDSAPPAMRALLAVGIVMLFASALLLLAPVRSAGLDCGSAVSSKDFEDEEHDARVSDMTDALIGNYGGEDASEKLQEKIDACQDALSTRRLAGIITGLAGVVLAGVGIANGGGPRRTKPPARSMGAPAPLTAPLKQGAAPSGAAGPSTAERLVELQDLYDRGLIAKAEFEAKRQAIIDDV